MNVATAAETHPSPIDGWGRGANGGSAPTFSRGILPRWPWWLATASSTASTTTPSSTASTTMSVLCRPPPRALASVHLRPWWPRISDHDGYVCLPLSHPSCLPRRLNVSVSSLLVTAPSCGACIGGSGTREAVDLGCEIRGNSGGCVVASWIRLFGAFSLSINWWSN